MIAQATYGRLPDGRTAQIFTLTNAGGMRVRLTNYGAITIGVEVPDRAGRLADVTLGFDTLEEWLGNKPHFGATVGRFANRIARGRFTLDGKTYALATNNGPNHLHGGPVGFDKVLWEARHVQDACWSGVEFTYLSRDGEEGYPGNLRVTARHLLTDDNEFRIEFEAVTDKPTIVNLAHHSYWNLAGAGTGDMLGHEVEIVAEKYTPVDGGLIPTGELRPVAGTPLDFRRPVAVGARIAQLPNGYDHNFVLAEKGIRGQTTQLRQLSSLSPNSAAEKVPDPFSAVRLAARVHDPKSGRSMEILTDQPGIQFYSGNFLDGVRGKGGATYHKHAGLCLETQRFPDAPNHPEFPSAILRPGETYRHIMLHRFPAS